jgi:hypothetical protein
MKKIINITLIAAVTLALSACSFLDVEPHDRVTKDQVIRSELAINATLNGIYLEMAVNELYGAQLTMSMVEVLAQRYNVGSLKDNPTNYYFVRYEYETEAAVQTLLEKLWEKLFVQCLAVNDFLDILDRTTAITNQNRKDWLRGEALALRAFHHFDILRLWGPSPRETDATERNRKFMPYNDSHRGELRPLQSADSILIRILDDLRTAEKLLENDWVRSRGVDINITHDPLVDFFSNRNYRMNYYAVKALQARVYLWMGDHTNAQEAARIVKDEVAGTLFPWTTPTDATGGNNRVNTDRIFSTEVLFGIRSISMYRNYDQFFTSALQPDMELAPTASALKSLFSEGIEEIDYRFTQQWIEMGPRPSPAVQNQSVFVKYAPPSNRGTVIDDERRRLARIDHFQPLIRMSEMYYILAECALFLGGAPKTIWDNYIYPVQAARRIGRTYEAAQSPNQNGIMTEIWKEYQKEFFGEGQLWFFYKRTNALTIPSGLRANVGNPVQPVYSFPMPQSEITARD